MFFSKRKAEKLKQDLDKFSKLKEVRELGIPASTRLSLQQNILKRGRWLFLVDLSTFEEEGLNEKDFRKPFSHLQKTFELLEKFNIKNYDGTACTTFVFDSKESSPVGGLILPTKLTLRPELIKRLGEPELSSFILDFQKSPLGLSKVKISVEDERLLIRPSIEYKLTTIEGLVENTFNLAKQVSMLFVEEKK